MIQAVRHAHSLQPLESALAALGRRNAGIHHGQLHVAHGAHARQQMIMLENEADLTIAQASQAIIVQAGDGHSVDQ